MDLIKKYNLPNYLKGKSFAEASKIINDKFKDRNDQIAKDTRNELLIRLAQAQEELKQPTGDQMFFGGDVPKERMTASGVTEIASAAGSLASPLMDQDTNNITSSALSGASAGSMAGPLGAVIGGLAGGALGVFGNNKAKKEELKMKRNSAEATNAAYSSDFAHGGKKYNIGGLSLFPDPPKKGVGPMLPIDFFEEAKEKYGDIVGGKTLISKPRPQAQKAETTGMLGVKNIDNIGPLAAMPSTDSILPSQQTDKKGFSLKDIDWNKVGDKAKTFGIEALRYAPALMNLKQLNDLEEPRFESLDRLGNRYEKDLVDESALVNRVSQEQDNVRNAIANASQGSVGALRSNLLGASIVSNKALSDAVLNAENINRGENRAEQQFNLGVDQANIQQSNLENDINARNEGIYDTNKSALLSQLGNDIGNIGKEARYKQMIEEMGICYDARGRYICGTEERVPKDMTVESKSYGGKTNDDIFDDYLSKVLAKKRQQ